MMNWKYITPLLFLACSEKETYTTEPAQEPVQEPEAQPEAQPEEEVGTDEDGDGFTVEDGDCDDTDPWTNPARSEEGSDGVDNDCDGMIDEIWSGLTAARQSPNGDHALVQFNTLGQIENEISLSDDCMPAYLDHAQTGWVASAGGAILGSPPFQVIEIDPQGNCSTLADFSEDPDNTMVRSVLYHPDGYYLASRISSLIRIDFDGSVTTLASWIADPNAGTDFEIHIWTIARDPIGGDIGLFGLYGGFATWNESEGLMIHKKADVENWDGLYAYSGTKLNMDSWVSLVFDGNTGESSVQGFDFEQLNWSMRVQWTRADIFPLDIAVNGDQNDFYITANAATYHTIWRVREIDQFIDDLYKSPSMPNYTFQGMVADYGTF